MAKKPSEKQKTRKLWFYRVLLIFLLIFAYFWLFEYDSWKFERQWKQMNEEIDKELSNAQHKAEIAQKAVQSLDDKADVFCKNQTFQYYINYSKRQECIKNETFFQSGRILIIHKKHSILVEEYKIGSSWVTVSGDFHMATDGTVAYLKTLEDAKILYPQREYDIITSVINKTECTEHRWSEAILGNKTYMSGRYVTTDNFIGGRYAVPEGDAYLCKGNTENSVESVYYVSCKPYYLNINYTGNFDSCGAWA